MDCSSRQLSVQIKRFASNSEKEIKPRLPDYWNWMASSTFNFITNFSSLISLPPRQVLSFHLSILIAHFNASKLNEWIYNYDLCWKVNLFIRLICIYKKKLFNAHRNVFLINCIHTVFRHNIEHPEYRRISREIMWLNLLSRYR